MSWLWRWLFPPCPPCPPCDPVDSPQHRELVAAVTGLRRARVEVDARPLDQRAADGYTRARDRVIDAAVAYAEAV